MRSDWFSLAPEVLREILADHDTKAAEAPAPFRFSRSPASAELYASQRRIHRYLRDNPEADALYVEEAVLTLATSILTAVYAGGSLPVAAASSARQQLLIERTREYLACSYAANVGLAALSREVGSSAFHLCRVFRQQTGFTIHQYRTQLRLRRSLELLEREPRDILMAALRLGFAGHSHYTRTFLRVFGVTPSRFNADVNASGLPAPSPGRRGRCRARWHSASETHPGRQTHAAPEKTEARRSNRIR